MTDIEEYGLVQRGINLAYDFIVGDDSPDQAGINPGSEDQIDGWISAASTQAGAAGFLTNMGGLLTLPIALPANVLGVLAIQLALITRIARCRGHDLHDPKVKALCMACLVGSAVGDILKEAGVQAGAKLGSALLARLSGQTLQSINKAVGFRLVTKAGSQSVVSLSKVIPVVGGIISGGWDYTATRAVGYAAKQVFDKSELHASSSASPEATSSGPIIEGDPVA